MTIFPQDSFGLIRRSAVVTAFGSDRALVAAARRNEVLPLAPGVHVPNAGQTADAAGRAELYRMRSIAVATSERRTADLPLSHDSAAALHRIPVLRPDRKRVHFISGKPDGGRKGRLSHVHAAVLDEEEITEVDGLAVTTLERTACDIAASSDFAGALVVFDAVLRRGADRALIVETINARRRIGAAVARRAIEFASPAAESVGESWSRAQIIEAGLPIPELQRTFSDSRGTMVVDFAWPNGVVGEFDGIDKYVRYLGEGETIADAVIREKIREDRLTDLDLHVIRWIWADLVNGTFIRRLKPRLRNLV